MKLLSIIALLVVASLCSAHEPGLPVISGPTEEVPVTFIPAQPVVPAQPQETPQPQPQPEMPQPQAQPQPELPMHTMLSMPPHVIENPVQCPAIEVHQSIVATSSPLEDGALLHKIIFETPTSTEGIAWVDVHFTISGGAQLNFRMQKINDNRFEFAPVAMRPGDVLSYKFTYCAMLSNGQTIDCDTELFSFAVAQHIEAPPMAPPVECKDIEWNHVVAPTGVTMDSTTLHKFVWTAKTPIKMSGFVDLHWRIGHDGDWINSRMTKLSEESWEFAGVPLKSGEVVEYFFTFCILLPSNQRIDCDTSVMTYTSPAKITQFISKSMEGHASQPQAVLEYLQPHQLTDAERAYLSAYPQASSSAAGVELDDSEPLNPSSSVQGDQGIELADANAEDDEDLHGRVVFDAEGNGIALAEEDAAAPREPVAFTPEVARASFARSYSASPNSLYGIEHADL